MALLQHKKHSVDVLEGGKQLTIFISNITVDIILNFCTAIKVDGLIVNKRRDIAFAYFKFWFFIDIIASFPSDALFGASTIQDCNQAALKLNKMLRLLRVFKLFRVFRIARIMKRLEEFTKVRNTHSCECIGISTIHCILTLHMCVEYSPFSSIHL